MHSLSLFFFVQQAVLGMEIGPSHIAAFVNLIAIVWAAAKLHASVENLKTFKEEINEVVKEHTRQLARIDIRVSFLEEEKGGKGIADSDFYQKLLDTLSEQDE